MRIPAKTVVKFRVAKAAKDAMDELASLQESARDIALERFRIIQPYLVAARTARRACEKSRNVLIERLFRWRKFRGFVELNGRRIRAVPKAMRCFGSQGISCNRELAEYVHLFYAITAELITSGLTVFYSLRFTARRSGSSTAS